MEESILDQGTQNKVPSKSSALSSVIDGINRGYRSPSSLKSGYDRELDNTPMDDYEQMYLIDRDNPEETLKDKSYLRDAYTTFMNSRDQINLMSERGKLVKDINPALEDIDYQMNYLRDKQKLKNLENTIPTLDLNSEEGKNALTAYEELEKSIADNRARYNDILKKHGETEGFDIEKQINQLNAKQEVLLDERDSINEEIKDYYEALAERSENYKPSSKFQVKEQTSQDKPWYSSDYLLYTGPGLTGSSMATVESYVSSALATGVLWLAGYYAATNVANVTPAGVVTNPVGWAGAIGATAISLVGNLYSRHRESLAQVYGAYRSNIESQLEEQGISVQEYTNAGREQLSAQNPSLDTSKITDDEIIDRVLSGEIKINDENLNKIRSSSGERLDRVYSNNMTLSALDVAETALMFAPLGKAMGKVITTPIRGALKPLVKPISKLSTKTAAKYNKYLNSYAGFNAKMAMKSPKTYALTQAAKTLGKMGFVAGGEMFEEGAQDVFDYDYIAGKYDGESAGFFNSLLGLADANYRVAKIISGIDTESELAKDPQFWNDIKGGFALGLFMGGPTTAYHSGMKTYKDMSANTFVRDIVADQITKKDAMRKAMIYSDKAGKKLNYDENVIEVLEAYKQNLPEGITEEDIDAEIKTAKSVFNSARAKTNKQLGKAMGYPAGTLEYNTMIGLQQMAQIDLKEATDNLAAASESDNQIYATLAESPAFANYKDEETVAATVLTKLNIQKLALQQLQSVLEADAKEGTEKLGIADKSNPIASSLLAQLPKMIENITKQTEEASANSKFSPGFIAAQEYINQGVSSYANLLIAQHDALVSEAKANDIFGNAMVDGKLVNHFNAVPEVKEKIERNVKARIDDYLRNIRETNTTVEENAKKMAKAGTTEQTSGVDANGNVVPESPIMDSRAKPADLDTKIPDPNEGLQDEEFEIKDKPKDTDKSDLDEIFADSDSSIDELAQELVENKKKAEKAKLIKEQLEAKQNNNAQSTKKSTPEESKPVTPETKQVKPKESEALIDDEFADATDMDKKKATAELERADANLDEDGLTDAEREIKNEAGKLDETTSVQKKIEKAKALLEAEKNRSELEDADSEERDKLFTKEMELEDLLSGDFRYVTDKVSQTLFFNPDSDKPLLPNTEPGKKLAERIKEPDFFTNSQLEFIINDSYTEKGYKKYVPGDRSTYDGVSLFMLVHNGGKTYVMAFKTPNGAKTMLQTDDSYLEIKNNGSVDTLNTLDESINVAITRLQDFRNSIITALENKLEDEVISPSTITRTNGIPNVNRKDGKSVQRPIQQIVGLNIHFDAFQITPRTVTFGIGSGVKNNRAIIGKNGEGLPGKGSSGQIYIYPPASSTLSGVPTALQINPARFSREQAEFLVDLIAEHGISMNTEYKDTGIISGEIINFMVRFGAETKVTTSDPAFAWLKDKQFYMNERGNIQIGNKEYNPSSLSKNTPESSKERAKLVETIMGMHWRVNKDTFFDHFESAMPSIADKFREEKGLESLDFIPGVTINRSHVLGRPTDTDADGNAVTIPMFTMGWMVQNELFTSDLNDQLYKDSFAYAEGIQSTPKITDKSVEKAATKAENTQTIQNIPEPQLTDESAPEVYDEVTDEVKKAIIEASENGTKDPFAIDDEFDFPARNLKVKKTNAVVSKEEIEWFKKKLGLQGDSLTIVEDAIALGGNEFAMGLVRENATLLWKGAETGTLYHEAYHRISLLTISPRERNQIYRLYRARTGFEGSDKALEEALAEEFRNYMLYKADPELNVIKRAWKAMKNFINKWVWRTDTNIDNIFSRINDGYYNRSKQNSEAVNSFLNTYKNEGAPFKVGGHKFKYIGNTQFEEVTNSLVSSLFTLNNVKVKSDLGKLNYAVLKEALNPKLTEKLVESGKITEEQALVRNEIYSQFDNVFKAEIVKKLESYSIRAVDNAENIQQEIEAKADGSAVGDQMAAYINETIETSVKDNALMAIKILIATLPKRELVTVEFTKQDGTIGTKKVIRGVNSAVTGLPLMNDFDSSWNTIINELHSENTFKGMMEKCSKLAKVYPIFGTLYIELRKLATPVEGETTAQTIARTNMQTQFRNTFRKAKHNLIGMLSEKVADENGVEQTNIYVKDESANKVSKNTIEAWNYNLERNETLVKYGENGFQPTLLPDGTSAITGLVNRINKLINSIVTAYDKPGVKIKTGELFTEYLANNLDKMKDRFVNMLNESGITIDRDTLNSLINTEYYDADPVKAFINLLNDKGGASLNNFVKKLNDLNNINEYGEVKEKYSTHISKYFNNSKFVNKLSHLYAINNPTPDELSVLSTDKKLLYPISEHNYLTDMVQNLDNDKSVIEKLAKVLYNTGNVDNEGFYKGSYLLTNLHQAHKKNPESKGKITLETFIYFKEQGSKDKGRKYTEISPLEDYIAKMAFLIGNGESSIDRMIIPTMGDSQTYNTIRGTAIKNFKQRLDLSKGEVFFDYTILKRFIGYFEAELDTIEFNYKNEPNMLPSQKVNNYDTGNRNGYKFRYFNGFFKLKETKNEDSTSYVSDPSDYNAAFIAAEELDKINGNTDNKEALNVVAQIRAAWEGMSKAQKSEIMNNYLMDTFRDELDYAAKLGVISWDGKKLASVKSLAIPQTALTKATNRYSNDPKYSKLAKNLGALDLMANHFANTISSVIEFEKIFIKDPAYYKDPVDKIKRLREVLSTGVTPRTDYEPGDKMADLTEVSVGTLADNYVYSRQADIIIDSAKKSMTIRLLQETNNITQDEAIKLYEADEISDSIRDAAQIAIENKFGVYADKNGKINQTDATVLISPEFYKELIMRVDGDWSPEIDKAFKILNDPKADLNSDLEVYADALAVTLKPLKYMYFGDHFDETLKRNVPIFNKMAMFPVHRIFSTGDMGAVLKVMEKRGIHMLAFDSAVKVGQKTEEVNTKIYTDNTNSKVDYEGLMNMPVHSQSLSNFRRQLITDPHHADRQMFVTQAQKAALGNIRDTWTYTTPDGETFTGAQLMDNVTRAHDALTQYGKHEISNDFGIDNDSPYANVIKLANILSSKAKQSNMNDNVMQGLETANGTTVAPISGLSDNAWIESSLISMINKNIVDTNLPGGMFIQMSSILYNKIAVRSDEQLIRKLNFANADGSMDCVISINLLKHIIPGYKNKTFAEAKQWLSEHDIIGQDSKALAMGYRIPAQGQSSTAALKVVDVYPEQIGDTITLPDEFTALTGSDFDIDKLFVARYNYDKFGKKIKFKSKEEYIKELVRGGFSKEDATYYAYRKFSGPEFLQQQKEAYENLLLDMYISVISNPMNFDETRQPLDVVTDRLKNTILKDVDKLTGQTKRSASSQLYYASPAFQSSIKEELNGGKSGIGPFALSNAHHVLTQMVKLSFKPNKILNEFGINNVSGIKSNDDSGVNILDWLSAMINAHVDVAKDPYIIRLNVRKLTYNITNLLLRSGKGESTFYFLPQQILKDFAIEYDKYSGFYNVDTDVIKNPESKARTKIWNKYYDNAKSLARKEDFTKLIELDKKGLTTEQRSKIFNKAHLREQLVEKNTFEWYFNQLQFLKAYEDLTPFAKSLSELTSLSQIDTKKFGNNFGLQSAFLNKWKKYMLEQNVFDSPEDLFFETFLGSKLVDGLIFPRRALQNVMIRLTTAFEAKRSLLQYYTKGYAIKDDTYVNNLTRAMEASYKSDFFYSYLKNNEGVNLNQMLYGKDSISRRLDKLKNDMRLEKYPELVGNVLLDNISSRPKMNISEQSGPDFLAYKPNKSGDNNLENRLIRSWEELYDSDHKEIRDFAKDLAIYSFFTSGDAFGKNNIFRYVPNAIKEDLGYFDYIRTLESDPEQATNKIELDEIFKNMWWNDHIVPTMEFYKMDDSFETLEAFGKPVSQAIPHEISGYMVTVYDGPNDKVGRDLDIPGIIYDTSASNYDMIGVNNSSLPIFPLYKKVKLNRVSEPNTTFLYKYIGVDEENTPVYRLTNKKGLNYNGNVLTEFGSKDSEIAYNNVLLDNQILIPTDRDITFIQDIVPTNDALKSQIFNEGGQLDPAIFYEYKNNTRKSKLNQGDATQQTLNFEENSESTLRRTYSGKITELKDNQVFVFGSNTEGRHGKGAALDAKRKFGAIYGQAEGPQGQSYAIITKDLTKRTHPSRTPEQIKEQIHNLYEYAKENPDKEFLVAYSGTGQNLNAYSNQEMADMFNSESIPNNIVFEQEFNKLIPIADEQPSETINIYAGTGENSDLSNFAIRPIDSSKIDEEDWTNFPRMDKGLAEETFQTVEGAFQAAKLGYTEAYNNNYKFWNEEGINLHNQLMEASGPEARKLGRSIKGLDTKAWDADSSSIMKILIKESFRQNPDALQRLLSTGNAMLTHTQDKGKWGTEFPRILMEVREELRNAQTAKPSETPTQLTELQQYASQVGLTESLPKVEEVKQAVEETKQIQDKYVYTFNDGLEVKLDFELNDQQKSALKELEAFVNGDDTSITLSGYAGTGEIEQQIIFVNHSGGANGADSYWGIIGEKYGVKSNHYWYKNVTPTGNNEISEADAVEGQQKVTIAARQMGRIAPTHQVRDERLIRNWSQVKYADTIFAVTTLLNKGDEMNYGKKASIVQGKGGTGYAVQMAINEGKPVYLYDQIRNQWYSNINNTWSKTDTPTLTPNFAGIGTRELNESGKKAIESVYEKTFANNSETNEDGSIKDIPLTRVSEPKKQDDSLGSTSTGKELLDFANQFGYTSETLPTGTEMKKAEQEADKVSQKYTYTFSDGYKVNLDFELNDQQKDALKSLEAFVMGEGSTITLSGYAGTGKTTIIGILYEWMKRRIDTNIIFSAPTHRANAITRMKTPGATVVTLQSLLGLAPNLSLTDKVLNLRKLKFEQIGQGKLANNSILFVDEASMIQDSLYDFLETTAASKGVQIVYIGDKGQLRPVESKNTSKVFDNEVGEQIQLTKVERTGDNPILKESTRVRNGEGFSYETEINKNGSGVEYTDSDARLADFIKLIVEESDRTNDPMYFRMLAATNAKVNEYNTLYRSMKYGRRPPQIVEGEFLTGYANRMWNRYTRQYKLINSGDYVVKTVEPTKIRFNIADDAGKPKVLEMEGYKITLIDALDNTKAPFDINIISNFELDESIIEVKEYLDVLYEVRKQFYADQNIYAARNIEDKINSISNSLNTMRDVTDAKGNLKIGKAIDYGYAQTVHKSQGGTYNKILIDDDSINHFGDKSKYGDAVRQELRYVAVSRAKEFVVVKSTEKLQQNAKEEVMFGNYNEDLVFADATEEEIKSAPALDDQTMDQLANAGAQRKIECK